MGIDTAITLLLALIDRSSVISALITKVREEGRTTLTAAEWKTITDAADAARAKLVAAIAAAS